MNFHPRKVLTSALLGLMLTGALTLSAAASEYRYPYYGSYGYYRPSIFTTHPILSGTLMGGAVGALGGAAVGALQNEHGSVGTGAAIGAGSGAFIGTGIGLIRNRQIYGSWF